MTDQAPEFHTKTLSPLSPLPVHPPEPSNIPVLQKQIDPFFNMTSTHMVPPQTHQEEFQPPVSENADHTPSADSSFSDAYKEQPVETRGEEDKAEEADLDADDYAKTFDSDGEQQEADNQDTSLANIEQEAKSYPVTVSATDLPSSSSYEPSLAQVSNNDVPINDEATQTTLPSSLPAATDAAFADLSSASAAYPGAEIPSPAAQYAQAESTIPKTQTYEAMKKGEIDIQQLLDNITANAEKNETTSPTSAHPSTPNSTSSFSRGSSSLPAHASLPPRPQMPQSHNYQDDISKYHSGPPGVSQSTSSYRPVGAPPSLIGAGAPGTVTDPRAGLPPLPLPSFRSPTSTTATSPSSYSHPNRAPGQGSARPFNGEDDADNIDKRWGPEVQKKYDEFLELERRYVTEGMWDRFPKKSRLFIGNLPSEKVTKRDLFHVFHKYGRIAQVSIKQAYGFIQFHEDAACAEALVREQGAEVRERKMHLEISRPQKNSRNAQANAPPLRRSRSPDYPRGGMPDQSARQGQGRMSSVDHYNGRSSSIRQDEYGRPLRMRDDYRPMRSPSPPRFRGGRDEYNRGRDSYGRERRRSRSRSPPYGNRDEGRYRERSLSPRAREANEDMDLQIPRREPRDVPDVQIILMDQLDRGFVSWIEGEFRAREIKTEVMFLSPRLPLQAVIRRQILEGVHAVLQLTLRSQDSSKIPLQVFGRQGGANDVRFDEYQDLEPKIAAELVHRAKQAHLAAQPPPQQQMSQYGQPQYPSYQPPGPQQTPYQAPAQAPAPNLTNLIGQLSGQLNGQLSQNNLQQLLSSLNTPQQKQNAPATAANSAVDLAGILNGLKSPTQQPQPQAYQPQAAPDPYAQNAALASVLGNGAPQQAQPQQQSAQQVQNIMAQLARFRQ